jgi:hypothetical protein
MNVLSKFCLSIFTCNTKTHIETQNTNTEKDKNIVKAVQTDIMENLESIRTEIKTLNAKTDTEL